jgi:glycerophosphoryl diester phosphodiesterase
MAHPFLDLPTPVVIAHRGASATAPENTLEAFQAAVDLGCRVLETDIHVTRDGVLVAFHDRRLDRQTDRRGEIEALTIAEVERADAGFHFAGDDGSFPFRGRGVRVSRLEQPPNEGVGYRRFRHVDRRACSAIALQGRKQRRPRADG